MSACVNICGLDHDAQCKAVRHFLAVAQSAVDAIEDNAQRADVLEGMAVAAHGFDLDIHETAMNAALNLRRAEEQQQKLRLLFAQKVND